MSPSSRPVGQVVLPEAVVEGAGVHLRRSIGTRRLDHLDPFLLLDHFDQGEVRFGPERRRARAPALVVFGDGDVVEASAGASGGRFLMAAARPLQEPIARYGPFVMNTPAEIEETLEDLRTGRFIRDEPRDE